jgi:SNF2 family DNA or RNA helicase
MLLALILKSKESAEGSKGGPTLVVAPLSLISQWEEEIETKTSLSYLVWYGDQTKGKSSEDDFDCDVVITSYGTIQAEMQKKIKKESSKRSNKGLLERDWLRVILDEAHCKRNSLMNCSGRQFVFLAWLMLCTFYLSFSQASRIRQRWHRGHVVRSRHHFVG